MGQHPVGMGTLLQQQVRTDAPERAQLDVAARGEEQREEAPHTLAAGKDSPEPTATETVSESPASTATAQASEAPSQDGIPPLSAARPVWLLLTAASLGRQLYRILELQTEANAHTWAASLR